METYTTDDALTLMGFGKFQALVLAYAGMGWVAEAMEVMLLSFLGPVVREEWNVSPQDESLLSSVVFAGMLIGACAWGFISDRYGRKTVLLLSTLLTSGLGLLSALSINYLCLLVLRFFVGIGVGSGHVFSSWFLEFVPAGNRGTWMVIFSFFWTIGTVLEASLAWAVLSALSWRWLLALSSLPCFLLLLFFRITPESPRYLCAQNRMTDASSFAYYGITLLTSQLSDVNRSCKSDLVFEVHQNNGNLYKDTFITSLAGLILSALLVDRFGRKATMSCLMFACCAFLGPLVLHQNELLTTTLLFGARACGTGATTTLCLYAPEVYPTYVRSTGVGIATAIGKIGGVICPLVAVGMLRSCHQMEAVLVFELVLFLAGVSCILFPVETKGREMD
uniref:Major facilitator superfamily (MFS) profile domain-containing protein n=1 Tax=Zea mays TaxID=4577 RepID=A0A804M0W8_MAIZE